MAYFQRADSSEAALRNSVLREEHVCCSLDVPEARSGLFHSLWALGCCLVRMPCFSKLAVLPRNARWLRICTLIEAKRTQCLLPITKGHLWGSKAQVPVFLAKSVPARGKFRLGCLPPHGAEHQLYLCELAPIFSTQPFHKVIVSHDLIHLHVPRDSFDFLCCGSRSCGISCHCGGHKLQIFLNCLSPVLHVFGCSCERACFLKREIRSYTKSL